VIATARTIETLMRRARPGSAVSWSRSLRSAVTRALSGSVELIAEILFVDLDR